MCVTARLSEAASTINANFLIAACREGFNGGPVLQNTVRVVRTYLRECEFESMAQIVCICLTTLQYASQQYLQTQRILYEECTRGVVTVLAEGKLLCYVTSGSPDSQT